MDAMRVHCRAARSMVGQKPLVAGGVWATVLLTVAGCGGKPQTAGKLVTGKVTYHDQPVAGAIVTFSSASASASGMTDEQGQFMLRTSLGENVPIGDYRVLVIKSEEMPRSGVESATEADYRPPDDDAPPPPAPKDLLPAQYKTIETTTLSASVTEKGPNEFTFPLTDH